MARAKNTGNGRVDRVEEEMSALRQAQANREQAQANLVKMQAALAQKHTAFLAHRLEFDAQMAEMDRRAAERFDRIMAILMENTRLLEALPDLICEKLGIKTPPKQDAE